MAPLYSIRLAGVPVVTPYEDLLRQVLEHGTPKSDRTGTGTRSLFGRQLRYDLGAGFPRRAGELLARGIIHRIGPQLR